MVVVLCGLGRRTAFAEGDAVWELTPYRLHVVTAVADDPALSSRLASEIIQQISERADVVVGASWSLEAEPAAAPLRDSMLKGWDGLTAASLADSLSASPDDKVILLRVGRQRGAYAIAAREYDVRTRTLGTPVAATVAQRRLVAAEAFRAVLSAFAPLGLIDGVEGDTAAVRLKAARLAPRDPALRLVEPGRVFRPVLRTNDRDGKPRRIQPLDWTLLTVQSVEALRVVTRIHTGLRSPLATRRRGRVEQLALAIRPPDRPTRLLLQSRGQTKRPLTGYEVYSHAPDSKATDLLGQTDGDGTILIPPGPGGVRVLLVKHGGEVLARLPLAPGDPPSMAATIADDDRRLEVEGVITGIQERFVDLLARRQVLVARIQARIDQEKWDDAKTLLDELKKFDARPYNDELTRRRRGIVSPDPLVQRKIDKLFNDTQQVVTRFLDTSDVDRLERDMNEAKNRGKTASAAPAR